MTAWAIVAAAGEGRRFGGPKAFSPLAGVPMIAHSIHALAPSVEAIVLVLPASSVAEADRLLDGFVPSISLKAVPGDETRRRSVRNGLEHVPADVERVVVHDAARPLVTPALVAAVLAALGGTPGAVAAIPERDTLKRADGDRVAETVPREGLWRAQTPQAFHTEVLRRAHEKAEADGLDATDDAMLVERIGEAVALVPGQEDNLKVTTREDLAIAEAILRSRRGA